MRAVGLATALLASLLTVSGEAAADVLTLPDGLHTWQIEGTSGVHSCCYATRGGKVASSGCRLDGRRSSIVSDGDCAAGPGAAQVYVRIANGAPEKIWLFSSGCAISSEEPIDDRGVISEIESVDWLRGVVEDRRVTRTVREQALFALVQTESDAAFSYLDRLLTDR